MCGAQDGALPFLKERRVKAFILDRYGSKTLRTGEVAEPLVNEDDVLVRVHAAGVNLLDSKIRKGELKPLLPVVDEVFPFEATNEALAYVETGRSKARSWSK